jgi:type I restriction enzyme S subunit
MSKIDELIAKFCPDGAEFVRLGDVFTVLRGNRLTKSELDENADYFVYHGGLNPLGKYSEYNREAETVMVINVGASAGSVGYSRDKFWSSDGCYCLSQSEKMESRFAYYLLLTFQNFFVSQVRRAGIPTLDGNVISAIRIPVPPLEVQKEIVNILDKFTQLEAELEAELDAELDARKEQYEYYRNQLLGHDDISLLQIKLGDVAIYSKSRIASNKLDNENYVGVDNLLQNKQGKINSSYVPSIGNMTGYERGDILIGNIRPYLKKIWHSDRIGGTNGDVLVIHIKDEYRDRLTPRYLYHLLASDIFFAFNMQNAKGAKMPRGDKSSIMKFEIQMPTIEKQDQVVSILDKFDILVNDISEGLPTEIAARRKQYEYYRTKLLTFKELK